MVKITGVEAGSLSEAVGVKTDDMLLSINKNEIRDVLDYRFYLSEKKIKLAVMRGEKKLTFKIRKGEYDDIGLEFETPLMDKKHSCKNGCIFCFIDQNPEGLRDSLYFKDDDSRLSFIHGNYITLTNMTDEDVRRIVKMRFSPINISVHTTNPDLRVEMMKNKRSGDVLRYLKTFYDAKINMCAQIVLCRGVNDGAELRRSMKDLSEYFPYLGSVSVVPAGLTKYREGLYPLSDFTPEEAASVIDTIDAFASEHKEKYGSRLFFAADEFYLKCGRSIPGADYYEDYPQIENGVGMIRSFSDEFLFGCEDVKEIDSNRPISRRVAVVTGVAAYPTICAMADKLMSLRSGLNVKVYKIINRFFGESITVAGLLTGKDIFSQLEGKLECDEILIPESALRHGEDVFLCGMTLSELSEKLGVKVTPCKADGFQFIESVLGIDMTPIGKED